VLLDDQWPEPTFRFHEPGWGVFDHADELGIFPSILFAERQLAEKRNEFDESPMARQRFFRRRFRL
jgi:hypothetical protein